MHRSESSAAAARRCAAASAVDARDRGIGRGAQGEVQRALFERNTAGGVVADGEGTVAHLVDVVVRDTRSRLDDGTCGWGLAVGTGAQVDVARAVFDGNREVGIGTNGPGSLLRFR